MEFRAGGTGAGIFAGCGVGLGFLQPLNFHGIPVLGQLTSGLVSSLVNVDSVLGGAGSKLRRRVQSSGSAKGLDLSFGCGVMIGYGYGVGFMLTPESNSKVSILAASLAHKVCSAVSLHGIQNQGDIASAHTRLGFTAQQPVTGKLMESEVEGSDEKASKLSVTSKKQADITEVLRLVVKQQNMIDDLTQQVSLLQTSVCKIDPSSPGCKNQNYGKQ